MTEQETQYQIKEGDIAAQAKPSEADVLLSRITELNSIEKPSTDELHEIAVLSKKLADHFRPKPSTEMERIRQMYSDLGLEEPIEEFQKQKANTRKFFHRSK
jgi:hypothetical protein